MKDKIQNIKMDMCDTILKYPTKFTQFRDGLRSVSIIVTKEDLVSLTLLRFPRSGHNYHDSINEREKLP